MAATLHWQACCGSTPPITQPCCLPSNVCVETTVTGCASAGGTLHPVSCGPIGPPSPPCFPQLGKCNCTALQITPTTVLSYADQVIGCRATCIGDQACYTPKAQNMCNAWAAFMNLAQITTLNLVANAECVSNVITQTSNVQNPCWPILGGENQFQIFSHTRQARARAPTAGEPLGHVNVNAGTLLFTNNATIQVNTSVHTTKQPAACGGGSTTPYVFSNVPAPFSGFAIPPCNAPCVNSVFTSLVCAPAHPRLIAVW